VNRTLLAVLAHPDDESFGMGGTLALYAHRGVDVFLVCATRGEVGEMDQKYLDGFNSIAERRETELRCAASHLGLKEVYFLNYRDSGMLGSPENSHPRALVAQPLEQIIADVTRYIRILKPQVVVTFDPIGGYRHPDHIAIHNATVKAFHLAPDDTFMLDGLEPYCPQKLYFHTMPHTMLRLAVRLMPIIGKNPSKLGKNKDIDLVSITALRFPIHARIDFRRVAKKRDEASACHASQGGGLILPGPFTYIRRVISSYDTFMRAVPQPTPKMHVEKDLFDRVS
jgi:N-acetyl-1-D-myo-inositol-2-amino-2-deoxy-alpha-D-glucopyranoside deacetylase